MNLHSLIFSNKRSVRICRHVLFWLFWFLFMSTTTLRIYSPETIGLKNFIFVQWAVPAVRLPLQIFFCYSIAYFFIPKYLQKKKYWQFWLSLSGFLFCFYWISYYIYWESWADESSRIYSLLSYTHLTPFRLQYLLFYSHLNFSGTVVSCSIVLLIKYYKSWYTKQRETESLRQANSQAELQLLKAQVHPHFLFNTLNNIYALSLDHSPKTGLMVEKLSNTIQYMITEGADSFVPLRKEIQMLLDYISLEKIRYGERLDLQINIQVDQEDSRPIAPLLLIPFVENCFKHGASKLLDKPWIHLHIEAQKNFLLFNISNNKPGNSLSTEARTKIGLANVRKRLQLLYPEKHDLKIQSSEKLFAVQLKIPLQQLSTIGKEQDISTYKIPAYVH